MSLSCQASDDLDDTDFQTKTAIKSKADDVCTLYIIKTCKASMCPAYCEHRYQNWKHNPEFKQKECLERCKTDHCTIKAQGDSFDTPLNIQLRKQLIACMKAEPTQEEIDALYEEDKQPSWMTLRDSSFEKIEKEINDKNDKIQKDKEDKERQQREQDEKKYDDFWKPKAKKTDDKNTNDNQQEKNNSDEDNEVKNGAKQKKANDTKSDIESQALKLSPDKNQPEEKDIKKGTPPSIKKPS